MRGAGTALPAQSWRLRLVQRLLYGQNVDRSVKSRARVGLAILVFFIGYAVIAARLVQLAAAPDSQTVRRTADAVSTSRPDILGRNGEILATDIKAASLFGEPRKIIDVDEAVELLTAVLPDLDATELRERLSSRKGFVWLKRDITKKQQQEIHGLGMRASKDELSDTLPESSAIAIVSALKVEPISYTPVVRRLMRVGSLACCGLLGS